ncbi:Imm30 family immunity protein [Metabacillus sp. FJAT-52054]|uniref:Imm30 family immunity protein n=1 Tax=Metabacillus sediminis TaxID=3117746 RepID=A0ABZ2NIX5_9BACI
MSDSINLDELTKELTDNRLLKTNEEAEKFEAVLTEIINKKDISHIEVLCRGFYDETEKDEVMFGVIHAIESYDQEYPLEAVLKRLAYAIPAMIPHAYVWLEILHKRILNHEEPKRVYANVIKDIGNQNTIEIIEKQLNEIKHKNPRKFKMTASYVLNVIKGKD